MSTPPSPESLKLNRKRRRLKAAIIVIALTAIMLLGSAVMISNFYLAYTAASVAVAAIITVPPLTWKYLMDYGFR